MALHCTYHIIQLITVHRVIPSHVQDHCKATTVILPTHHCNEVHANVEWRVGEGEAPVVMNLDEFAGGTCLTRSAFHLPLKDYNSIMINTSCTKNTRCRGIYI